jgi:hypothetical protein
MFAFSCLLSACNYSSDLLETQYLVVLLKFIDLLQFWLKWDKSNRYSIYEDLHAFLHVTHKIFITVKNVLKKC